MLTGNDIAACARTYLATPFVHQARLRGVGVDCAGLVICAARDAGLEFAECTAYGRQPDPQRFLAELRARLDAAAPTMLPGVVLHFAFAGWPMHLGIALDAERFIHAYYGHDVIISTLDSVWAQRVRGYWRYRGVTYG